MRYAAMLTAVCACTPAAPSQAPLAPDATDAPTFSPEAASSTPLPDPRISACTIACSRLDSVGCHIGGSLGCPRFLLDIDRSRVLADLSTGKPITCEIVSKITSKADAQRIGFSCQ